MKILVADDHPLFRAGIRHVLLQLGDSVEVIEADDHAAAVKLLRSHTDIALLLLDLLMPGIQGIAALEMLTKEYPALPIVILSASEDRRDMQRALDSGALGFIQKSTTPAVMLSALRLVLAGGVYVPPALVQNSPTTQQHAGSASDVKHDDSHRDKREELRRDELTPRQSAVLTRVIEGKSNKAIATELGLTEATVKAHVTAVFKALRVTNRMQAAIAAGKFTVSNS